MANLQLSQNIPQLFLREITDPYIRKNFENLVAYFQQQNQLLNFKFFEQVFTGPTNNLLIAHGFNYIPQDIVITKVVGSSTITFNHGLFDGKNINLSSTGAARIRFLVGTYWNFQSQVQAVPTDAQQL